MKFAIIAEIHANLEAFQAVLADSNEQRCTHYAFLGDFVGYCADPKACVDIVRAMNAPCVKGNHDEYCATDLPVDGLSANIVKSVRWTREQLTDDYRQWLQDLPYARQVEDFTIVHATLDHPQQWQYEFDGPAAATIFSHQNTQMCFFGHTHVPVAFIRDTVTRGGTFTKFKVEPGKKYFVNPGAVGQPLDNNPKAAYVVYDMDERTIELRRSAYDYATTRKKIREAGLGD
ncbi:MAG TPA: metallophosphoesterase family protein [Candidatus Acidoferrales bacterium]|jgi:predicted phosphodiesterase|nr:metallophosphoesterase family protein [Candidatus Acidoferrales bacterium]